MKRPQHALPLFLAAAVASPLLAQTPAPRPPVPAPPEVVTLSEFEVSTNRDTGYLATNATSGTRVNTALREIPLNISVISQEFLQDAAIYDVDSILQWNASNTGPTNPRIRGLNSNTRVNGFSGSERDDAVSIQRVEVVKGPGAVISGSSGPGGIVNVITKRPQWRDGLAVATTFTDRGLWRTEVDAQAHAGRTLAVRAAVAHIDEGEFSHQRAKQSWDDHYKKETTYYLVGQWRPLERTTVTANVTYLDQKRPFRDAPGVRWDSYGRIAPATGQPTVYPFEAPFSYPRSFNLSGPDAQDDVENTQFDFEVVHEFSPDLQVKLLANGRERSRFIFGPASTGLATANAALVAANPTQGLVVGERYLSVRWDLSEQVNPWGYNAEINALWKRDSGSMKHRVLAGANRGYGRFWSDSARGRVAATSAEQRYYFRLGDKNPSTGRPADLNMVRVGRTPESKTTERNAFLVHQGEINDGAWHTMLGLFYYDYRSESTSNNVFSVAKNDGVNPQIGLVRRITPWLNAYAIYAESIQGQSTRNSRGEVLPPFQGTNYELGLKLQTDDNRYSGTLSVFQTDFLNRQFNDPTVPDITGSINPGERVSGGKDRSEGVDLEVILTPVRSWQIIAGYAYLDTRVLQDRRDQPFRVGQRINNHAYNSVSVWTRYTVERGPLRNLSVGGGIRGNSGSILQYVTISGVPQPAEATTTPYAEVFASHRFTVGRARLHASINVKNLLNRETYQFFKDNSTAPYFEWKDPMEFHFRVGVEF
jgi:iron complex outermembrane recepter protein